MPLFNPGPVKAVSASDQLFSSGTVRITGGPGITVGSDASGATISGVPAATGSFFENAVPGVGLTSNSGFALASTSLNSRIHGGRLLVQPLTPSNELFPMYLSATEVDLNFWASFDAASTTNFSQAFTSSFYLGLYTRSNSTRLGLLNSAVRTLALGANLTNSARLGGARYLSFHSSLFSVPPNFVAGEMYFFVQLIRTAGVVYDTAGGASMSQFGLYHGASSQRSGDWGAAINSGTSVNAWYPFMGVHSLTTHTALPANIAHSDVNKASTNANFIPHLILNGGLTPLV